MRRSVRIDWAMKESARAKMRVMVKRLLRKYRYPPDKQEQAVQTILEQAAYAETRRRGLTVRVSPRSGHARVVPKHESGMP